MTSTTRGGKKSEAPYAVMVIRFYPDRIDAEVRGAPGAVRQRDLESGLTKLRNELHNARRRERQETGNVETSLLFSIELKSIKNV